MDDGLESVKRALQDIQLRNQRVELDKAWERSSTRRISISAITYVVASGFLYLIGVTDFYLAALVPVAGYVLSTLSLPFIKEWWAKGYQE